MSARRSRLNVKPNIGGTKGGPAKPATRTPTTAAPLTPDVSNRQITPVNVKVHVTESAHDKTGEDGLQSSEETSNSNPVVPVQHKIELTSATKSTANKTELDALGLVAESVDVDSATGLHVESNPLGVTSDKSVVSEDNDKKAVSQVARLSEGSEHETANYCVAVQTPASAASKNNQTSALPTRARLRRFGKVNVPSVTRGAAPKVTSPLKSPRVTSSSLGFHNDTSSAGIETHVETETKGDTETSIKDKETVVNLRSKLTAAAVKGKEDHSSSVEPDNKPKPPIRGRLPKTTPNLADLAKRRPKKPEVTSDLVAESATDNSVDSSDTPVTVVTKENSDAVSTAPILPTGNQHSESSENTDETDGSETRLITPQLTAVQPRPGIPIKAVKGPVSAPIPISPVKQPGDKRSRTISTTEAPAVKRRQRPKVLAPTDKPPDRTKMRMSDLIHWRPKNNPMIPKEAANTVLKAPANEQATPDTVPKADPPDDDADLPMPQVTIGPDGNIVINEKSLVMKNPAEDKGPHVDDDVIDETELFSTYGSFKTRKRSKVWSKKETVRFYKALGMVGIDFFLLNQVFPDRSRFEVKMKFKREEKQNGPLVERVLRNSVNFDESLFDVDQQSSDSEEEAKAAKRKAAALKREKKATDRKKEKDKDEENKAVNGTRKRGRPRKKGKSRLLNYYEDTSDSDTEKPTKKASSKVIKCVADTIRPSQPSQENGHIITVAHKPNDVQAMTDMYTARHVPTAKPTAVVANSNLAFQDGQQLHSSSLGVGNLGHHVTAAYSGQSKSVNNTPVSNIIFPVFNSSVTSQPAAIEVSRPLTDASVIPGDLVSNNRESTVNTTHMIPLDTGEQAATTMLPSIALPPGSENDQFVLVTVQPEGGEDTVIHIYRVHGNEVGPLNMTPQTTPQDTDQQSTNVTMAPQTAPQDTDQQSANATMGIVSATTDASSHNPQSEYAQPRQYYDISSALAIPVDEPVTHDDGLGNVLPDSVEKAVKEEAVVEEAVVEESVEHHISSPFTSPQSGNNPIATPNIDLDRTSDSSDIIYPTNYKISVADIDSVPSVASPYKPSGVDHDDGLSVMSPRPVGYRLSVTEGVVTESAVDSPNGQAPSEPQLEDSEIVVETDEMLSKTVSALLRC